MGILVKNQKGASLPLVFLIAAMLVVLGFALASSVVQWYKIVRDQEHVEYTYFASESAIERCFKNLDNVITTPQYTSGILWTSDPDFADKVINKIASTPEIIKDYNDLKVFESDGQPKAAANLKIIRAGAPRRTSGGAKLIIPVGVTSQSSLFNGIYRSVGRKVFAQREFEVHLQSPFKLNAAVYTIGDLIATDGVKADIVGDVNVYGTTPRKKNESHQYYYGGIYAKRGSGSDTKLSINGNAYTRSFIRAGTEKGGTDGSSIHITKDAIAQGIQIFGKSDLIAVYRNAYTFDDMEVDGEDSVIAVNGSFIGLSYGDQAHHDAASAIINAAPIHHFNSAESKKSRIVVNEDVVINGGTFRIDTSTGVPRYQIEDASIAWLDSAVTGSPAYKSYGGIDSSLEYREWLKLNKGNIYGYFNLFQVWRNVSWSGINTWLSEINRVRNASSGFEGNNDFGQIGSGNRAFAKNYISGYSHYVMAACNSNLTDPEKGKLFFMDKNNESSSEIKQIENLNNGWYRIDNIPGIGNDYWKLNPGLDWGTYCDSFMKDKLRNLRTGLLNLTHVFVERDYPPQNEYAVNAFSGDTITHTFAGAPGEVKGVTPKNKFLYLQASLNAMFPNNDPVNSGILKFADDGTGAVSTVDVGQFLKDSSGNMVRSHFLIINNDPDKVLQIKDQINAVIFSMGKVEILSGATIRGAVLAAGRGYDPVLKVKDSAAEYYGTNSDLPRVPVVDEDGNNSGNFEIGDYAGVLFREVSGSSGTAQIFFPGRDALLKEFHEKGIDLYPIF